MKGFVIVFLSFSFFVEAYDYCKLELDCPKHETHIGCHPESDLKIFPNRTKIPLTRKLREIILDAHNYYRNQISCGGVEDINQVPFPPATKMRELQWDNELEYLAGLHGDRCSTHPDGCRTTTRFKLVGQNIGSISGQLPNMAGFHVGAATKQIIKEWFEQHKIASYESAQTFQGESQTRDFFQIINDRVSRIGCALTICYFKQNENMFLVTCNYSYQNMNNEEVYASGAIITMCDRVNSRRSSNYRCLCETSNT